MSTPERASGARALLRFLVRQGRLGNDDVARIEGLAQEAGVAVHDVLEREAIIGQKDLALLLAETLRLRMVDLTTFPLDANITRELKETIATRYEVVPIGVDERSIEVVTSNPLDLDGLKAVEFATGKRVQAVVATHVEVRDALAHTYRLQESLEQFLQLVPAGESLVVNELDDDGADLRMIAADAELPPVIKLADKMLIEGIKTRASDVHVEPGTDSVLVRYRVDGILEEGFRFPKWIQNPLVARLKVMAKLDITERRMPQDGRIQLRYLDKTVDMRVSSLPAQHGEKITLRILDASQSVKALDRLGLGAPDLKLIREAAKKPQGMILITGPTGSGKTTTLYALLREILSPKTNIVTIENPIEYQLKGINQVEVNEKQGLTFSEVLRSVLRQDPDVILFGEIRDKETAQIAFQAAATGHLVLSTVHTNDAAGAVTRLLDLGLEPYAVSSALNLVVAQRLIRQLCQTCSTPTTIDDETRRHLHIGDTGGNFKQGRGCAQCRHTGYRARIGVYEMLPMTAAMVKLIEAGAGESMVRQQSRSEGIHTLLEDAIDKLRTGVTSVEELERVVQITESGKTQCPGCQKEISDEYSVCPHCSRTLKATCSGCAKPMSPEWVRCPFCGSAATEAVPEPDAAPVAERRSFKALVVDDTSTIRDVVRHTLEHSDLGLTVLTAENGREALEVASRERPDIVILDISMPEMDGFEVCRRLRSEMRTAFVPVLMLTAHDSEDDVAKGFGVGADDYMVKPFRREGLVARVRRILERTYGSQALGGAPETTTAAPSVASAEPAAPALPADPSAFATGGVDVAGLLAELASDRDVLRRSLESCETRIGELAAREHQNGHAVAAEAGDGAPAYDELKDLLRELRAAQERVVGELRDELAEAKRVAEDALRQAGATPVPAIDPAHVATMLATVERLQGEQARLAGSVEGLREAGGGADQECERRLREVTQELAQLRAEVMDSHTTWLQSARVQTRADVDEAVRAVQTEAVAAAARLTQSLTELRGAVEAQRDEQARDGARVRSAQEIAERAEASATAATDVVSRELASLQRALAEQREQREQDVRRITGAEDAARRTRTEATTTIEQMTGELAALRRTLAEQLDDGTRTGERLAAAEEAARSVRAELAATIDRIAPGLASLERIVDEQRAGGAALGERLASSEAAVQQTREETAAVAGDLARELAALREAMAAHGERPGLDAARIEGIETVGRTAGAEAARALAELAEIRTVVATLAARQDEGGSEAGMELVRRDAVAAAETAMRVIQEQATAIGAASARDVAELRETVAAHHDTQQRQMEQALGRLTRARRAAAKLVRRVRDATRAVEARAVASEQACQQHIAALRDETVTALDAVRAEQAELTGAVEGRLADLPSAAEHRTVLAFLDGCETQLTEFAARLDARGAAHVASEGEARAHLGSRIETLEAAANRLEGEQLRLAADVEERSRALMRTAAGGFDVQLALLRGKVEVLARTLRERIPTDQVAPSDDALLGHRQGLLERLRTQLTALQSATEWGPQRVLDLLVESTLAAAVTPFRRMLQVGGEASSEESAPAPSPDAKPARDESASPSSDL